MQIIHFSTIGTFHTNHNEDFHIIESLGTEKTLIAVMDGCTMGKESHFASTLTGKILRKIAKEISYLEFIQKEELSNQTLLNQILEKLFRELNTFKQLLMLETEELLNTLLIGVVNQSKRNAEIIIIGDGLVCCNHSFFEFDQEDKPDYLGYHLNEQFSAFLKNQTQRLKFEEIYDLSISTDGIFSFKEFNNEDYKVINEQEILEFLLTRELPNQSENPLHKRILELETTFGLKPTDDLSIIRLIFP